jgi:3-deoxy-7-phosphoheptulonate synthase
MLVVMERTATAEQVAKVVRVIETMGLKAHAMPGAQRTAIGITGNKQMVKDAQIAALPGVLEIIHVTQPFKLVSREFQPTNSLVQVGQATFGGAMVPVIAGPCSVESEAQTFAIAERVKKAGATLFRGGAFKPRTSPYEFQGLGEPGLEILARMRERFDLPVVTEAVDPDNLELVEQYADMIQIGARNMQNYSLLKRAGRSKKPVLLKRGLSATLTELLMAAEYILSEGNHQVVLCERGVRTFADHTRNTLDLSAIPYVHRQSHLPIIADPSHGTGRRDKVDALSRASVAVGADGLIVEVHNEPEVALSDGMQSLYMDQFDKLMATVREIARVVGRTV